MREVLEKGGRNWVEGTGGGLVRHHWCESIFRGERAEAGEAIRGEDRGRCFLDGHRSK